MIDFLVLAFPLIIAVYVPGTLVTRRTSGLYAVQWWTHRILAFSVHDGALIVDASCLLLEKIVSWLDVHLSCFADFVLSIDFHWDVVTFVVNIAISPAQ